MSHSRRVIALLTAWAAWHGAGSFAAAEKPSRYDQLVSAPAHAQTIHSMAMAMMAMPHEPNNIFPQLQRVWWANQDGLPLAESVRQLEASQLRRQVDVVESVVRQHGITRLTLAGFTQLGTVQNLDYYFVADTKVGPVVIRASLTFPEDSEPRLHRLKTFVGWEEAREALAGMQEKAGERCVGVTYTPQSERVAHRPDQGSRPASPSRSLQPPGSQRYRDTSVTPSDGRSTTATDGRPVR